MLRGQISKIEKRPKFRFETEVKIHNRFDVFKRNIKTGEVKQVARAYNLICDSWWTKEIAQFSHIAYGEGTGTPSASDTALFTRVGANAGVNPTYDASNFWDSGYYTVRKDYTIPAGTETGTVFTEIGIAYDGDAGHLVTHALLEDMNGNPISITKGASDDLILYATIYVYVDKDGYEGGGVRINYPLQADGSMASSFSLAGWLAGVSSFAVVDDLFAYEGSPPIAPISEDIAPESEIGSKDGTVSFSAANKQLTISNTAGNSDRVGSADLNPSNGCIRGLLYAYNRTYGGSLSIALPMNGLGGQGAGETDLGYVPVSHLKNAGAVDTGDALETDFQTPFPFFIDDSSFKIYLDGIEESSSNYTVDADKPQTNNIGLYFNRIEGNSHLLGIDTNTDVKNGMYEIAENPFYGTYNITSFYKSSANLHVFTSDDLITWTEITGTGTVSVPSGQQNDRYWKATVTSDTNNIQLKSFTDGGLTDFTNIHFTSAPGSGVVISHDAHYECIPKSTDTYFDVEVVITLAEKV